MPLKLLHTADWHLGDTLHERSRVAARVAHTGHVTLGPRPQGQTISPASRSTAATHSLCVVLVYMVSRAPTPA